MSGAFKQRYRFEYYSSADPDIELEMIFLLHRLMQYPNCFHLSITVPVENYVFSTGKAVQTGANIISVLA
ncbi:MAG: hypothetical protein PF501_18215 [Salinisphaera sp.]|nr:hypothetical protein [Salinisphaera sp.]